MVVASSEPTAKVIDIIDLTSDSETTTFSDVSDTEVSSSQRRLRLNPRLQNDVATSTENVERNKIEHQQSKSDHQNIDHDKSEISFSVSISTQTEPENFVEERPKTPEICSPHLTSEFVESDPPIEENEGEHKSTSLSVENLPVTPQNVEDLPVTSHSVKAQAVTPHNVEDQPVTSHNVKDRTVTSQNVEDREVTSQNVEGQPVTSQNVEDPTMTSHGVEDRRVTLHVKTGLSNADDGPSTSRHVEADAPTFQSNEDLSNVETSNSTLQSNEIQIPDLEINLPTSQIIESEISNAITDETQSPNVQTGQLFDLTSSVANQTQTSSQIDEPHRDEQSEQPTAPEFQNVEDQQSSSEGTFNDQHSSQLLTAIVSPRRNATEQATFVPLVEKPTKSKKSDSAKKSISSLANRSSETKENESQSSIKTRSPGNNIAGEILNRSNNNDPSSSDDDEDSFRNPREPKCSGSGSESKNETNHQTAKKSPRKRNQRKHVSFSNALSDSEDEVLVNVRKKKSNATLVEEKAKRFELRWSKKFGRSSQEEDEDQPPPSTYKRSTNRSTNPTDEEKDHENGSELGIRFSGSRSKSLNINKSGQEINDTQTGTDLDSSINDFDEGLSSIFKIIKILRPLNFMLVTTYLK